MPKPETEMVERVVQAVDDFLEATIMSTYDGSGKWCIVQNGQLLEVFSDEDAARGAFNRLHAAAVIGAMREPTEGMVDAGANAWENTRAASRQIYQAMIDAALGRKP